MRDDLSALRDVRPAELQRDRGRPADQGVAREPPAEWVEQVHRAREFLILTDPDLLVRFINHTHVGGPDPTGQSMLDYLSPAERGMVGEAARVALDTGYPQHFAVEAPGPAGGRSHYSNWLVPLRADGPGALAFIAVDNGHTVRVEEELEGERGLLASLVAQSPDHITVVDRDHRIAFTNRGGHGWAVEDAVGAPIDNFIHPDDRERVHAVLDGVFESGQPASYRARVESPQGQRHYLTRAGAVVIGERVERVSLVSTDITDQVRHEELRAAEQESLRQSEERFRVLVEYAPEAVVIFDPETALFTHANDNACRLFGYSKEKLAKLGPIQLSPPEQPDGQDSAVLALRFVERALSGEHVVFEWLHLNAAGETFPCEVRLVRLPHPDRMLVRGSLINISERKRAEAERNRLAAELFQAQKMQALGQLTGGVAHDFNNLLTVMMGNTEMIQSELEDRPDVCALASQVMQATQRAAALTQHLLAFARRQPLRPQRLNVDRLVADLEPLLRRSLGETINIETIHGTRLWPCEADPVQLENAILNLAINARDAMPAGGRLTIETANTHLDREHAALHEEAEPGEYVMLVITDTGTGMPKDVVEQAFEPFFTTKVLGHGSGLGLSMVHGFVKQSGGHVELSSEVGVGTTVRIYLPRALGKAAHLDSRAPVDEPVGDGSLVLVVEDADDVRDLAVRMAQMLGYRTLSAPDAVTALALLAEHPVRLLLTDVVLAGPMNGAELARAAAEKHPDLHVSFMSGYAEDAIAHDGRLDRGVTLLEKPFTRRELAVAIREALNGEPGWPPGARS